MYFLLELKFVLFYFFFSKFLSLEWLVTIDPPVARKLCKHCYGKLMIKQMVSVIKGRLHSDEGGGIEDATNRRIEQ